MGTRRTPVSIVTVFNDPDVRRDCLDRSFEAHRAQAPDSEYLPIDNTAGAFPTAGAALNHGASQARHDHVVFVHQDVYLHSVAALEEAAGMLAADDSIGLLGAIGPTADERYLGRIRDRVFLLGEPAPEPADVDCVDEVLFIASRAALAQEPLAEDPELAWHAYAVEYGLRARARGRRVCVADIPLTHNSLTVNLDRLEVAYAALAERYPDAMPVMTPQGQVGGPPRPRDRVTVLDEHRWRFRWLIESRDATRRPPRRRRQPVRARRHPARRRRPDRPRARRDPAAGGQRRPLRLVRRRAARAAGADAAGPAGARDLRPGRGRSRRSDRFARLAVRC